MKGEVITVQVKNGIREIIHYFILLSKGSYIPFIPDDKGRCYKFTNEAKA
jgi:hypothetical protein